MVAHRASTVLLADRVALLPTARSRTWAGTSDLLNEVPAYRALLAQDADLDPSEGALR